jgi:signal transduction histidine kinase
MLAGEIRVSLRCEGSSIVLAVTDTGVGILDAELAHVFERFHRVEGNTGRTHEGTGIGLALVQELAKLHGGTVAVESALGEGSTFSVTIPLGRAHLPADRVDVGTVVHHARGHRTSKRHCGWPTCRHGDQ